MLWWSRTFKMTLARALAHFSLLMASARFRRLMLGILTSSLFILCMMYRIERHLHQTLYIDFQEKFSMPREGIPTGRQEKITVEELHQASKLLKDILARTGKENTKISVLLNDLSPYKSPSVPMGTFPYGCETKKEVMEMYNAAKLLYDKATKFGDESEEVGELNHQLSILRRRKFPNQTWTDSCDGCMKYKFNRLISPRKVCEEGKEVEFVNLITSVPGNIAARMAIRETWGRYHENQKGKIRIVFLFGAGWSEEMNKILLWENEKYGDILQDDFKDGYYNLAYKVLMGYKWVQEDCTNAKFVMRAADDAYIHVPRVLELLKNNGDTENFQKHQVGLCFEAFKPYRYYDYKGYLSYIEYPKEHFPPYALGTNFLTSQKLTQEILKASENVPFLCIEDAYIGLVLNKMNRGCQNVLSFVGHTPKKLKQLWYPFHCNAIYWYTYHPLDADFMDKIHKTCSYVSYWSLMNLAFYTVTVMLIIVIYMIFRQGQS